MRYVMATRAAPGDATTLLVGLARLAPAGGFHVQVTPLDGPVTGAIARLLRVGLAAPTRLEDGRWSAPLRFSDARRPRAFPVFGGTLELAAPSVRPSTCEISLAGKVTTPSPVRLGQQVAQRLADRTVEQVLDAVCERALAECSAPLTTGAPA